MFNIIKKTAVLFVFVCITVSLIYSCSDNNGSAEDGAVNPQENAGGDILQEDISDSLPGGLDFEGAEIRLMHREEWDLWCYEIAVEGETGDIVNDAVYHRNKTVEERLNVRIKPIPSPGGYPWLDNDRFNDTVRNSVMAGSDDYDIIAGYAYFMPVLASEGIFYNWNEVSHIKPGEPWWCAGYNDQMTIGGKMYFITGDIALSMLTNMFVMYFNKDAALELELENLYQTVLNGEFTIDKVSELIKDAYRDLNGNSRADADDMYGYITTTGNFVDMFYNAFDQPVIKKNRDGIPQLMMNTQKMINIIDKIYNFFYENDNVYAADEGTAGNLLVDTFTENRVLFMPGTLYTNEELRAMDSDYGILPLPKWDKDQADYYTTSQNSYSLFSIPVTCTKIDTVGAAVEALCAESYRRVSPAYYEIALKTKYSRDEETSQMLDLIRAGITFDFGVLNSISLDNIQNIFRTLMTEKSRDFVSRYEQSEYRYEELLRNLADEYRNLP
ncbi:MAG: hypothetical protein FWH24_03060 [Oscillospiraceae bacterium]|nr:hypothetical protein [Oscillospiraceae bacterium]